MVNARQATYGGNVLEPDVEVRPIQLQIPPPLSLVVMATLNRPS